MRSDFTLQPQELDDLARICRLTEGMPLGLVLAAGWLDVLSLARVAAEIQRGLDILETEQRDVPERQRSVRATFNYSWERLSEEERQVFIRLMRFGRRTVATIWRFWLHAMKISRAAANRQGCTRSGRTSRTSGRPGCGRWNSGRLMG